MSKTGIEMMEEAGYKLRFEYEGKLVFNGKEHILTYDSNTDCWHEIAVYNTDTYNAMIQVRMDCRDENE